ncbi:exonuclease [Chloropicon primus]|nr:exonuclease [Chloropicon primus]
MTEQEKRRSSRWEVLEEAKGGEGRSEASEGEALMVTSADKVEEVEEEREEGEITPDGTATREGIEKETPRNRAGQQGSSGGEKRKRDGGSLSGLGRGKLKKLTKRLEQNKGTAAECYAVYGPEAKATLELKVAQGRRIRIRDVQVMLLWLLASTGMPNWMGVRNKMLVEKVVVVFASGLCVSALDSKPELFKNISGLLGSQAGEGEAEGKGGSLLRVESLALNSFIDPLSTVHALLTVPHRKKKSRLYAGNAVKMPYQDELALGKIKRSAKHYALTPEQMEENGYPVASPSDGEGKDDGGEGSGARPASTVRNTFTDAKEVLGDLDKFRTTGKGPSGGEKGVEKLVAIDCEMCTTENGPELTRVTLVDDTSDVLYDKLVKPESPILDYVTEFSGITAEMLENVTTTLSDVQEEILRIIDEDTFLVGHSLENDLVALKLLHRNVIDTAILYPHNKGPPYKFSLKALSERYLGKAIQVEGHNPIEDACTAMELCRLKIHFGPSFGAFEIDGVSMCKILTDHKKCASLLDREMVLRRHAVGSANAILCKSDEDVAQRSLKECKSPSVNLVWASLCELYEELKAVTNDSVGVDAMLKSAVEAGAGGGKGSNLAEVLAAKQASFEKSPSVESELRKMDERVGRIYSSLPRNAMLIVLSGQGNTAYVKHLMEMKFKCIRSAEESVRAIWDGKCDEHLHYSVQQAAQTVCLVGIKQ